MKRLIIVFSAVIITMIAAQTITAQPFGKGGRGPGFCGGKCIDDLNLTDEQQSKIFDMRTAHQKRMIDLNAELDKKELELAELKDKGDFKRSEVIDLVNDLTEIRGKIALEITNHWLDVYDLLDDSQKKELKDNMDDFRGPRRGMGFGMGPGGPGCPMGGRGMHRGWRGF